MEEEKKYYAYQILDINDLEGEIWKDIDGYEGLYQVSNVGRVKSINYRKTGKPQILKQRFDSRKYYLIVDLSKEGKLKTFLVHRLVALAFIENPNNLPEVNHIDEIKTNNSVQNLEFCTAKYNTNYGSRNERHSKAMKGRKHTQEHTDKIAKALTNRSDLSKEIVQIDPITKIGKKWESSMQAQREDGFNHGSIIQCCKGKRKTHKGYKFQYFTPPAVII